VLLFEDVDGWMPAQPWDPAELSRVLDALAELAEALTPSPIDAPSAADRLDGGFRGWRRLAADHQHGADLADLDPWAVRNLPALAELEAAWIPAATGCYRPHYLNIQRLNYLWTIRHSSARIAGNLIT
jgi:hypothetical protein